MIEDGEQGRLRGGQTLGLAERLFLDPQETMAEVADKPPGNQNRQLLENQFTKGVGQSNKAQFNEQYNGERHATRNRRQHDGAQIPPVRAETNQKNDVKNKARALIGARKGHNHGKLNQVNQEISARDEEFAAAFPERPMRENTVEQGDRDYDTAVKVISFDVPQEKQHGHDAHNEIPADEGDMLNAAD